MPVDDVTWRRHMLTRLDGQRSQHSLPFRDLEYRSVLRLGRLRIGSTNDRRNADELNLPAGQLERFRESPDDYARPVVKRPPAKLEPVAHAKPCDRLVDRISRRPPPGEIHIDVPQRKLAMDPLQRGDGSGSTFGSTARTASLSRSSPRKARPRGYASKRSGSPSRASSRRRATAAPRLQRSASRRHRARRHA